MISNSTELAAFVAVLVLLYNVSSTVRYYLKWILFLCLSGFFASVFIPIMFFRPRDSRNALMPAWGARQVSHLLGLKWNVRGKENIVKGQGCIILLNHQSFIDLLVLAELWPIMDRCTVIAKKEVLYLGPFGIACWLWGSIFIDRLQPDKARESINKTAAIIKDGKMRLLVFPEGTRNSKDELLPFKKGAFHVAIEAQVPLQPVVVSRYRFLDLKKRRFDPAINTINILPAIPTTGLEKDDLEELMMRSRQEMNAAYVKVSKEMLNENNS